MGKQFTVTPDDLVALASRLDQIRGQLEQTQRRAHVDESAMGDHQVAGALDEFTAHWEHGHEKLIDRFAAMTAALRAGAAAYQRVDESVARSEQRGGGA